MHIAPLVLRKTEAGGWRVEAAVDGETLWFSSTEAPLAPSAEGFASALLVAASCRGTPLVIDAPLDAVWFDNAKAVLRQLKAWWGFAEIPIKARELLPPARGPLGASAQCFTGGVDSFYELFHAPRPPSALVYIYGYDGPRDNEAKFRHITGTLEEVAAAHSARPIVVTSNLRELACFEGISWPQAHGGALAAVAHLLSGDIGHFRIPSSYPHHDPKPWGSHWDLDPLWSSSILEVAHGDATLRRNGKVRAIADDDLARRHVRVCNELNGPPGNCSACEKCLRTMIAFEICGKLDAATAFDNTVSLVERIEDLKFVDPHLISIYDDLVREVSDPALAAAILRLQRRSASSFKRWHKRFRRWRARLGF